VQQAKAVQTRLLRWRKAFAAVIAASRRDADFTQAHVADEMGWARNTVTRIENGTRTLAVEEMMQLCQLYKIEPRTLLDRLKGW